MDLAFPEKYYAVSRFFDYYIGDLAQTPLLTDEQRLLFYALRQQAEHGPCTAPQPSMWYMTERHKHQAWQQLGRMSTFEAMVFFVQQFERVLWSLEHPDDDDAAVAAALMKTKVDWPARLREAAVELPSTTPAALTAAPSGATEKNSWTGEEDTKADNNENANDNHDDRTEASQKAVDRPPGAAAGDASATTTTLHSTGVAAASSPPAEIVKPAVTASTPPQPALSADEMQGWDEDVVAHSTLTLDNLRYLAAQLMQARRAGQTTRAPVGEGERHADAAQDEELPVPLPPTLACVGGPSPSNTTPPLKPMWTIHGKSMRVPIIPPPVRFSARSMTEAAVRQPRDAFLLHSHLQGPHAVSTNSKASWLSW